MSTHYDEETVKEMLELAQKVTGCHLSYLLGGELYAREDVLTDVVPTALLKKPYPEAEHYYIYEQEAPELFLQVRQHLQLPEHYDMRAIRHYPKDGEWFWNVDFYCESEPFPAIGTDTSREAEGIWLQWSALQRISCHGIGKGHAHE